MSYDPRWQRVTCKACGRSYRCTPEDDYYKLGDGEFTGPGDGYCFRCMLDAAGINPDTPVAVIEVQRP